MKAFTSWKDLEVLKNRDKFGIFTNVWGSSHS